MSTRVAINDLGRIGRSILKLVIDEPALELAAVNDLTDVDNLAYLLRFDTVYGRYSKTVTVEEGNLAVAGRKLETLRSRDPLDLPWKELGIELVFECTGALTPRWSSDRASAQPIVAIGKASAAIVKLARAQSVDLIVMGVSGRDALGVVLLGSTTHHVIR